jgi:hypothetical protein
VTLSGWRLPPHKKKGHKIRAMKDRQRKIRTGGLGDVQKAPVKTGMK